MIKQRRSEIDIAVNLHNVDASVFFGDNPGGSDTFQKFFADVQTHAGSFDGTDPETFLAAWTCDQIPSPENQWQRSQISRYYDPAYDALVTQMQATGALAKRIELAKAMNDKLMQEFIMLPFVHRGRFSAHTDPIGGVALNITDSELRNHRLVQGENNSLQNLGQTDDLWLIKRNKCDPWFLASQLFIFSFLVFFEK